MIDIQDEYHIVQKCAYYNEVRRNIVSTVDPLSYVDMCIECITDPLITVDDVMTVISQLNNSAAGHDGLPASIMKKLSKDYVIPLTHCKNMSIVQGDFPDTLNRHDISPVFTGIPVFLSCQRSFLWKSQNRFKNLGDFYGGGGGGIFAG